MARSRRPRSVCVSGVSIKRTASCIDRCTGSLRSSLGTAEERALLYWLLPEDWKENRRASVTVLAGSAGRAGFDERVHQFDRDTINIGLKEGFQRELAQRHEAERPLRERFLALLDGVGRRTELGAEERAERNRIVGELRRASRWLAADAIQCVGLAPSGIVFENLDLLEQFNLLPAGTRCWVIATSAVTLPCVSMQPLGKPVVPEV